MKRIWKLSETAKPELLLQRSRKTSSKTLISALPNSANSSPIHRFTNHTTYSCSTTTTSSSSTVFPSLVNIFTKVNYSYDELVSMVSELINELTTNQSDSNKIIEILESKASTLFSSASVVLLKELKPWPNLALQVFNWRKKVFVLEAEEYALGITIAGRLKNVDLAAVWFKEAFANGIKSTSIYNALMGVYMYNGLSVKAQDLFRKLKGEKSCGPNIVSYNILLSIFGRFLLVKHMETTLREIQDLNLAPNSNTYNHVIAGYVSAWMWEDMERVYKIMEESPTKPDLNTHLLMLRGYAHSGNLEKMEEIYNMVKCHVDENSRPLIRAMICAYCKSSDKGRVTKVEALLKLVPEEEYRPWLNVLLIRLYAQENLVETMESFIAQAVEHNTIVTTKQIMRAITAAYFRCNAVERFTNFLKEAEASGWKVCRSLYHSKLLMYSSANRLDEMDVVLEEMQDFNLSPTHKTFEIMYKAYSNGGHRSRVEKLLGTMCKHGFEIPLDVFPS